MLGAASSDTASGPAGAAGLFGHHCCGHLPAAAADRPGRTGRGAPLLIALFTATSAICVTGLAVVDIPTYWSGFGQAVILALFQVGGFGIMSGATLLALLVTRRLGLSTRLIAQAETRSVALGDVAAVLRLILVVTICVETLLAAILIPHLRFAYHEPWGQAIWHGVFHAASAFNNAGLSTYSDSLVRFAADPLILVPIMVGVVLGGLGIPVLHELRQKPNKPARWSIHTKLTLLGTAILLFGGFAAVLAFEWKNPTTLGPHDPAGKLLGSMFYSAMTRSGGFNAFDTGEMRPETLDCQLRTHADRRRQRRNRRRHQGDDLPPARVRRPGGGSRGARHHRLPAAHRG